MIAESVPLQDKEEVKMRFRYANEFTLRRRLRNLIDEFNFVLTDELGFDANLGIHPYHDNNTNTGVFLMMDLSARYKDEGTKISGNNPGTRVSIGPVFVFYRENMMFRLEYKIPVYERALETRVAYGNEVNVGIGFTF